MLFTGNVFWWHGSMSFMLLVVTSCLGVCELKGQSPFPDFKDWLQWESPSLAVVPGTSWWHAWWPRGWRWFLEREAPGQGPRCVSRSAASRKRGQQPSPPRMSSCLSHVSHTGSTWWWIPGLRPPWTWRTAQSQLQSALQVCCSKLVSNFNQLYFSFGNRFSW